MGAGFAGVRLYHQLKSQFNILLIDPKDNFEYYPDIVASIAKKKKSAKKNLNLHAKIVKNIRIYISILYLIILIIFRPD